jgi:hypothetical protein
VDIKICIICNFFNKEKIGYLSVVYLDSIMYMECALSSFNLADFVAPYERQSQPKSLTDLYSYAMNWTSCV